jgi:NAD(P)-dependent dehydrogenase (short-subunit alcohol dehydrogenase family)
MTIAGMTVMVTGANRGIGRALVAEALARGAPRVFAGTRQPLAHPDARVTPLTLDVTSAAQIQAAAGQVESLDILINNAGVFVFDDLGNRAALEAHLAVNFFGTYSVTQAFLPALTRSGGAIVNNVSLAALAPIPLTPAYSISKAAAFSLTQSLRILLAGQGVRVHAVLTGPVETDMMRDLDIPKASPQAVARAVFDGVDTGEEDIFPDPLSASMADSWRGGAAKALERQNAALAPLPRAAHVGGGAVDGDLERPEHPNPDHRHLADRKINLTLAAPQPGRKSLASQPPARGPKLGT